MIFSSGEHKDSGKLPKIELLPDKSWSSHVFDLAIILGIIK